MTDNDDKRPTPDPTILTTEQLLREIQTLKDWVKAQIDGLDGVIDERFASVAKQFTLIERQRVEQKADTEKAVQAALSAAKEAVKEQTAASDKSIDKAQTSTASDVKQQGVTFATAIQSQDKQHNDLKDRVTNIEARGAGRKEDRAALYAAFTALGTALFLLIGFVSLYLSLKP